MQTSVELFRQKSFNKALETKKKVKHFVQTLKGDEDKGNFTCVIVKDAFLCLE